MDPAKMKVVDLRSELGALGLDTKGNKPALVERLKKALESKTGKLLPDTSILDTSNEDIDEVSTPRKPGPAARTRRSSSTRVAQTPAKQPRLEEPPEPIEEDDPPKSEPKTPSPTKAPESVKTPSPVKAPQPVKAPEPVKAPQPVIGPEPAKVADDDIYCIDDERSQSPVEVKDDDDEVEAMDVTEQGEGGDKPVSPKKEKEDGDEGAEGENRKDEEDKDRPLTEEEEWEQLNERLKIREQERLEREKRQAEEDAQKLADVSKDPVKLNRLKRKMEKKARWSNYYKSVEITNEVLTPPTEALVEKQKQGVKETGDVKAAEPELDDDKITLSWYDSDLNQYLELPELNSVVPLSEGAFAHAWAGTRASHGVTRGRVCYEVRIGAVVATTEITEKESIASGLRVGWSTDDSTLHLGEGERSWGYESSGRAVHNGEYKDYGKQLTEKDVVGVYLDLESNPCKISYTVNGVEQGTAYEFDKATLDGKVLYPHIITKNLCYRVNFGYDRYNMLTKTKIVRNRLEIPVEQVLEEKKAIEAEIQKQKDEAARRAREKREQRERERQERQKKKKEEREKAAKERKEKEAKERQERGEAEPMEEGDKQDGEKDKEGEADKDKEGEADKDKDEDQDKDERGPKENGDKPEEEKAEAEVKEEPMETESAAADESNKVKDQPTDDGDVQEVTEEQVLKGHVLDKRIKFVIRYTVSEELDGSEACLLPGYILIAHADLEPGPRRPKDLADCEVILMVGMPGAGKSYWVKQHIEANPDKRYNILSTGALFDKMKVDCKPFRATYEGRWDAMVTKCAKCVLKLLEMAKGRRRNFILDQTNVYPSAQKRKLREFHGYRRVAVVIVTDEETYRERYKRREETDGKEVPDGAIVDMKANFTLPQKSSWLDDVIYPELDEEEAKKVLEAFHKEAKAAGVVKERERRERSDGPPAKRQRSGERPRDNRDHRRRDMGREREDRWGGGGGGGGGGRWGPVGRGGGGGGGAGGGGGRWGRERGPERGPPPPQRFDRWGAGPPRDFGGRDRDGFRGGRGGPGGPGGPGGRGDRGGPRGPGGPGGPGGPAGPGLGGPTPDRFRTDRRVLPGQGDKRNNGPNPQGMGGAGGWQRGGGQAGRGGSSRPSAPPARINQKDGNQAQQSQNPQQQSQQPGWNQWGSGWGGWGNWNQNPQGWGNWGNWGNWNANANANATGAQQSGSNSKGQTQAAQQAGTQQQWPANYTAQQWYQWQQWQQQQQQWSGYQQQQQGQQGNQGAAADAQQAWAQYYQNYGAGNAAASAGSDKK